MSGFGNNAWLWWGGGAAMALAGLALIAWAMTWDWLRTRKARPRRCPKCWYDLSGTESLRCSECGHAAKRERKLHKSRRRWRWAIVGVVLILASAYPAVQPKVQRDGWWSLVSNRMLIAGLPMAGDIDHFWCREMARRVQAGTGVRTQSLGSSQAAQLMPMTQEDWRRFFERCVKGDPRARPVSEDWRNKYGKLIDIWTEGSFHIPSDLALAEEHALYDLPPRVVVRTREQWPAGVPVYVEGLIESWWPYNTPRRARIDPELHDGEPIEVYGFPRGIMMPSFDRGVVQLRFDAEQEYNKGARTYEGSVIESVPTITLDVEVVPSIDDCVMPVRSDELNTLMTTGLMATIEESGGPRRLYLMLDVSALLAPQFDNLTIGAWAEALRNGEVVDAHPVWWRPGKAPRYQKISVRGLNQMGNIPPPDRELMGKLVEVAQPGDVWEFRLRSDPEIALRVLDCDKYWEGEITIPLTLPLDDEAEGDGNDG